MRQTVNVGDEYIDKNGYKLIITKVYDYGKSGTIVSGIYLDGDTISYKYIDEYKKTGRYFPDIIDLLKKIEDYNYD